MAELSKDQKRFIEVAKDTEYLMGIINYCKKNPRDCTRNRLANILYKVEADPKFGADRLTVGKAKRGGRSKRSSGLLFMLFNRVQREPTKKPKPVPRGALGTGNW